MLSQAPPASVPIERSLAFGVGLLGLGLINLAVLAALGLQNTDTHTLVLLGLLFCGVFFCALRAWWNTPVGELVWDGSAWRWSLWPQADNCRVQWTVALPGLSVIRLSWERGSVHWLVAGPSVQRHPQWLALRRALVAIDQRVQGNAPAQPRP